MDFNIRISQMSKTPFDNFLYIFSEYTDMQRNVDFLYVEGGTEELFRSI